MNPARTFGYARKTFGKAGEAVVNAGGRMASEVRDAAGRVRYAAGRGSDWIQTSLAPQDQGARQKLWGRILVGVLMAVILVLVIVLIANTGDSCASDETRADRKLDVPPAPAGTSGKRAVPQPAVPPPTPAAAPQPGPLAHPGHHFPDPAPNRPLPEKRPDAPPAPQKEPEKDKPAQANAEYDGDFMLMSSEPEAPGQNSDTSHLFEDSGKGSEAFPCTDRSKMLKASNVRCDMGAQIDNNESGRPPSRLLGDNTMSWQALLPRAQVRLSETGVAFGGSSHSDEARAALYGAGGGHGL